MDKCAGRVFLDILGVFSMLGEYSCSLYSSPCLSPYLGLASKVELPFKDTIENQGRGKKSSEVSCGHVDF